MMPTQYATCVNHFQLIKDHLGALKQAFADAYVDLKALTDLTRKEHWHVTCEVQQSFAEAPFAAAVRKEIARAREELKYPPMASLHEGYAVIKEEIEEFWDVVKKKPAERNNLDMYKELVQIAAMAQRTAEDLKLGGEG